MDLKTLKKLAEQKAAAPKDPPPGMAGLEAIAEAVGLTPKQVARALATAQVKRSGTIRGTCGKPGYSYYDLARVAAALGVDAT